MLAPFNLFAVMPHMHQLGSHMKTTVHANGQDAVIHDGPFSFDEQIVHRFEPLPVRADRYPARDDGGFCLE